MNPRKTIIIAGLLAAAVTVSPAQEAANKEVITIPKEQFQKLLEDMQELKAFKARFEAFQKKTTEQQAETDQSIDDLSKETKAAKQMAKDSFPGSTKLLMTGYGSAGFISQDHGGEKKFSATFNPIFLWKINDRLLFEAELEAQLEGTGTGIALEMAQFSYLVNDYMTIGAGKFLNPMDYFVERQHMAWVNKLPDKPLAVYDGLLPETQLGIQIRGGVPVGPTKFSYAFYLANANALNADTNTVAPGDLGTQEFNNFDNVGKHLAVGGRIGFSPFPELEIGYGFQLSDVAPPQSGSANSLLQSVDLSYVRDSERLKGVINLKAQWVWSNIGRYTYDPSGTIGGPYLFNNSRNGGYVQLAYRPSRVSNSFLKNLEPVFRYDMLSQARTPTGTDETRYTFGLNYWLGPMSVIKVAYEIDQQSGPNADRHNAVLVQFATGF